MKRIWPSATDEWPKRPRHYSHFSEISTRTSSRHELTILEYNDVTNSLKYSILLKDQSLIQISDQISNQIRQIGFQSNSKFRF